MSKANSTQAVTFIKEYTGYPVDTQPVTDKHGLIAFVVPYSDLHETYHRMVKAYGKAHTEVKHGGREKTATWPLPGRRAVKLYMKKKRDSHYCEIRLIDMEASREGSVQVSDFVIGAKYKNHTITRIDADNRAVKLWGVRGNLDEKTLHELQKNAAKPEKRQTFNFTPGYNFATLPLLDRRGGIIMNSKVNKQ